MRKRLVNQQCLSRRLLQLSLLCAMMLTPLGAWAGEFTKTYNYFWQDTQSYNWKNYFCADATKESGFIMGTITNVTIYSSKTYYRVSSVKVVAGVVAAATDFDNANVTVSANGQAAQPMTVTPSSQNPGYDNLNTLPTQEYSFTFADAPLENQEVAITITNNTNPQYGDNGGIDLYVKSVTITYECNVTVGGVAVSQENESDITGSNIEGTVAYDSDTNTLTLTNANIKSGGIQTDDDLTIKVIGSPNYINGYITTTKENATLTFKNGSNAEASLQINQSFTETKSGFSTVNYDGMYLTADNDRNTKYSSKRQRFENSNSSMPSSVKLSSAKTYELWVGGTKVTEANKDVITSDFLTATESGKEFSVKYNSDSHRLTLKNVTLSGSGINNYGIISRLPALEVEILDANEIICGDTCTAIRADAEIKQSLTFTTNSWTVDNYSLAFKAKKAIRDFNEVELDHNDGLYWNNSYDYVDGKLVDYKGNEVQDKSAVIGDTEYYGLSVGGVEVTNKNYSNITGGAIVSGKFSYDYYEKVLTIDGSGDDNPAVINTSDEYGILNKKLSSLTVKLKGQCTINTSSSEDTNPIHSEATNDNGVTLKFVKDEDYAASTSLALMSNPQKPQSVISGFTNVNFSSFATSSATGGPIEVGYENDLLWMLDNNSEPVDYATDVIFVPAYNLWVNGERVTDDNKDAILSNYILSGSSIKFNNVTKTLTLNNVDGVEFDSTKPFIKNGLGNMTIHIVGENELHCGRLFLTQSGQSESTYNVTFTTNPAAPGTLVVKNTSNEGGEWYEGHTLTFRNELTLTETPWTDQTMYSLATIQIPSNLTTYGLVVGGVTVTPDNAQKIAEGHDWIVVEDGGELSFDPENNTLTMKDVTITMPDGESAPYPAIVSGLDHLTVNISGYNSLNFSGGETYGIQSTNANAELVITKKTVEEEASLSIGTSKPAFDGFKSVTYEKGLVYDKSNLIIKGLETPSPYANYNYGEKALEVGMEFDPIEGVTVYYSIDYADESKQDVENAVYDKDNELFISSPCTFTVYSKYGEYTSPVSKAKVFAFAEPTITAQYGVDVTVNAPTLLPAVENTDQITVRYAEYIEQVAPALNPTAETPVAEIDETTGVMTINKPGTIKFVADCTSDVVKCWNLGEDEDPTFILTVNDVNHGITVTKDDVTVSVTNSNRTNVLNDENASVQFDGRRRLVLNGADLTSIVVSATNDLPETGLDIYLEGDSKITNNLGYAIESEGAAANLKLAFHTGADAPGTLTYTNSGSASENVFPGFDVSYFNKLAQIVDGTKTRVMIPLNLITDDVEHPANIDYGNDPEYSSSTTLNNVTIEDVLYTLVDNGAPSDPDGFVSGVGGKLSLIINSTMTDLEVEASDALVPGTSAYYGAYQGLTFIVPAGTGVITLYNVVTENGYAFHVRVGNQPPVEVTSADVVDVPYACSDVSYVKLYLVDLTPGQHGAPAMKVDHRIGPKSSVAGALGGVKVSNSSVQSSAADPAAPYKAMEKATMATDLAKLSDAYNGYTCNDPDITDLSDNLVANTSAPAINPAPRRGGDTNTILPEGLTYLDFSGTKITGMEVSRTSGPFNGVPENVFIYMPAGNTTKDKNVVIGDICDNVELVGSANAKPFKALKNFTAGQATLKRTFEAGSTDSKATIYLPYNIAQGDANKLGKFYKYAGNDGTTVSMNQVTSGGLKANMPYIFEAKEGGVTDLMVHGVDIVADPAETQGFKGVYKQKDYEAGMYCYAGEDKGGKYTIGQFVEMGSGSYVPPFRAYMIGNGAPSYAIAWDGVINNIDDENTTAVETVKTATNVKTQDGWWTINGMRLNAQPKKAGLYILNGRMVVVK